MNTDHDIKVLNSLIETTLDSADGYRQAAEDSENPSFRRMFEERSFERRQVTTDLQAKVRELGGEPEDDGTILAAAHRRFLDLKHALKHDEEAIVSEVENGEDFIKEKYEEALKDDRLSATAREVVQSAYTSVKTGHDQMRDLKHSLKARH